jgi:hypothetical protein
VPLQTVALTPRGFYPSCVTHVRILSPAGPGSRLLPFTPAGGSATRGLWVVNPHRPLPSRLGPHCRVFWQPPLSVGELLRPHYQMDASNPTARMSVSGDRTLYYGPIRHLKRVVWAVSHASTGLITGGLGRGLHQRRSVDNRAEVRGLVRPNALRSLPSSGICPRLCGNRFR